jgi:hypothetical protein
MHPAAMIRNHSGISFRFAESEFNIGSTEAQNSNAFPMWSVRQQ